MNMIFNSQAIKAQTDTGVLVKMPKSDFAFWHPLRMSSQKGKGGYMLKLWVPNDSWTITARRTSAKTRKTLEEWTGTVAQAVGKFNIAIETDEEIKTKKQKLTPKTEAIDELVEEV